MGMRDVLSHHYFDLDAEAVYTVCQTHVPELIHMIQHIFADLNM